MSTRYADVAQMFADCAADLDAFNSFHYGVQAHLDITDSALLPLLHVDAFINVAVNNGQITHTVEFSTLTKGDNNGNLTYTGPEPRGYHLCKALDAMELAGQQVIAWLAGKMEQGVYPYTLQQNIGVQAVPIVQEYNGVLTGWRWSLALEGTALNDYCDIIDLALPLVLALDSVAVPTTSMSNDGRIALSATGGTAPLTFTLNGGTPNSTGLFEVLSGTYTPQVEDATGEIATIDDITLTPRSDCGDALAFDVDDVALADGSYDIDLYEVGSGELFLASIGTATVADGTAECTATLPCEDGGGEVCYYPTVLLGAGGATDPENILGNAPADDAVVANAFGYLLVQIEAFQAGQEFSLRILRSTATAVPFRVAFNDAASTNEADYGNFLNVDAPNDTNINTVTFTAPVAGNALRLGFNSGFGGNAEFYQVFWCATTPPQAITPGLYELQASGESLGTLTIDVP